MDPNKTENTPLQNPVLQPSVAQQSTSEPIVAKKKYNKKILIILGIVAIVLMAVLGGLYYLGSKNNSSNNTYLNTYTSPTPSPSASATPSDLTPQEQDVDNSINQLDQDQKSIDQGLNDQGDSLNNL